MQRLNRPLTSILFAVLLLFPQFASAQRLTLSGIYGVGAGGTGAATFTAGVMISPGGTTALSSVANVAAGQVLVSGTPAAWSASPTLTTSLTNPLFIGGTGVTSTLTLRPTSGIGAAGADIILQVGNNGATEAARILNSGVAQFGLMTVNGGAGVAIDVLGAVDLTTYLRAHSGNFYIQSQDSNTVTEMNTSNRSLRLAARSGFLHILTDGANNIRMLPGGNFLFGGTTSAGTSAQNVMVWHGGTAPSTSPADVVQLWAGDIAGAGTFGLNIRDEGGNVYSIGNGQIQLPDGTAALPAVARRAATNTGLYFDTTTSLTLLTDGFSRLTLHYGSIRTMQVAADGGFSWSTVTGTSTAASDIALLRDAANIMAQRNGANAQTFRGYGTFTDATNYERWALSATIGTGITLAAETAGTGGDNLNVAVNPAGTGRVIFGAGNGVTWTTGTKPACAAGIRGTVYYVAGATLVLDTFEVCRKDAADAYAWVTLF